MLVYRQHLNHKEPLVGKDLLDGGRIVRKRFCRSPRSDTVRRFYEFDVDLVGEAASNGDAGRQFNRIKTIGGIFRRFFG